MTGKCIPRSRESKEGKIIAGIPRFCDENSYTDNWGLQWNIYRSTQLDSNSGLNITFNRFWNNTRWKPKDVYGKTVLEVGSGAGRFTEILLEAGCKVVSFDYSRAVEANHANNSGKGDLFLFQGNLYDLPQLNDDFDFVFCYGVIQHTPDPKRSFEVILSKCKENARVSIDCYRKPMAVPKRVWRPITSQMDPEKLYRIIEFYIPKYLPIDTFLKKFFRSIPLINRLRLGWRIPIPCWNYLDFDLDKEARIEWAIMDTFDALAARYDFPLSLDEMEELIESKPSASSEVFYGSNGIVANIIK